MIGTPYHDGSRSGRKFHYQQLVLSYRTRSCAHLGQVRRLFSLASSKLASSIGNRLPFPFVFYWGVHPVCEH
jgi:hypothetical protein